MSLYLLANFNCLVYFIFIVLIDVQYLVFIFLGDPKPDGCLSDEISVQVTGLAGDFCSPTCSEKIFHKVRNPVIPSLVHFPFGPYNCIL